MEDTPYYIKVYEEEYNIGYILDCFENGINLWTPLIKPSMYQKALSEFVKYGTFIHFPTKYIYQWANICVKNCCLLYASTILYGRTELDPSEEIIAYYFGSDSDKWTEYVKMHYDDAVSKKPSEIRDWSYSHRFLDDKNFYDWLRLPNGEIAVSDYAWGIGDGTGYNDILPGINMDKSPEELIVMVNRILDVGHISGDLASVFIEGGSKTLGEISERGYLNL